MKNYTIVKWYEKHQRYCLEFVCYGNLATAQKTLTECQAKDPTGIYKIHGVDKEDAWWTQGGLD